MADKTVQDAVSVDGRTKNFIVNVNNVHDTNIAFWPCGASAWYVICIDVDNDDE